MAAIQLVEPVAPLAESTLLGLAEELVADSVAVDLRCADRREAARLQPRLLGISLFTLAAWSFAQAGLLEVADLNFFPRPLMAGLALFLAYVGGIVGALAASLPVWFVACALAGIDVPAWRLTVELCRALAVSSMLLLGLLPLLVLGALALLQLHPPALEHALYAGFALPFGAGVLGRRSILAALEYFTGDPVALRRARPLLGACTALLSVLAAGGTTRLLLDLEQWL